MPLKATVHGTIIIAFLASISLGQSIIGLCGTVTNASGSPLAGVSVKLQKKNLTAISGGNGTYCITVNAGVSSRQPSVPDARACALVGNRLMVTLVGGDRFGVSLFDVRGRTLWTNAITTGAAGRREVMLPKAGVSSQAGLAQVTVGPARYAFRFVALSAGEFCFSHVNVASGAVKPASVSKTVTALAAQDSFPILDTLVATGQGFAMNASIRSYVYRYVDTIDFALGAVDSFSEARQQIVHRVNDYRSTIGLGRLIWDRSKDACVDTQAQMDFASNTAHSAFGRCQEFAQNECPGWGGAAMLTDVNNIVVNCMQEMWNEGPGTPYSAHGHYINMTDTSYTKMACGFYFNAAAGETMWATQDFF